MTPFLYCKKAELLDPKGGPPARAAVSIGAIGGLLITLPREVQCPVRVPVDIRFYDPIQGLVRCRCRLSSPLVSGSMRSYRCEVLEQLTQIQRREDIKVTLSVMVSVDYEGMYYPAAIQNLSAGGVFLVSSLVAMAGEQLSFNFDREGISIPLTAEILRVELQGNNNGRSAYGYGCRFINLPPNYEAQLRSYACQEARLFYRGKKPKDDD